VKYIHPNTLFISWQHWVPSYVRTELKKKTGIVINEYGEKMNDETPVPKITNGSIVTQKTVSKQTDKNKNFTPITSYKPTGNLIYNEDLLSNIK
jgi:aspartokinase